MVKLTTLPVTQRCENNIKTDRKETGYERMGWIYLAHDREKWRTLVNTVMNLQVP
jgi:23S rRNA maturation mini-RNase III